MAVINEKRIESCAQSNFNCICRVLESTEDMECFVSETNTDQKEKDWMNEKSVFVQETDTD